MKQTMIAIFIGFAAMLFTVPGAARAEQTCGEFCAQAGDDTQECRQACQEYLSLDNGGQGSLSCLLKAMEKCDMSMHNIIEILKLNVVCLEHGFEDPRCNQMCGVTEGCIKALCCGSSQGQDACLHDWKFQCKKNEDFEGK